MTDNVSKEQRSATMAKVKSTGNRTTEVIVEAALLRFGIIGWEKHPDLPGKPDFYFPSLRLMLFVDGCYWHGCPKHVRRPTSNTEYWNTKIEGNRLRDARQRRKLRSQGYHIMRVWEHDLKHNTWLKRLETMCRRLREE